MNRYWVSAYDPDDGDLLNRGKLWIGFGIELPSHLKAFTVHASGDGSWHRMCVADHLDQHDLYPVICNNPDLLIEINLHREHKRRYDEQARKHETCWPGACKCRLDPNYYGSDQYYWNQPGFITRF